MWNSYFDQSLEDIFAHGVDGFGALGSGVSADAIAPAIAFLHAPQPSPLTSGPATIRFELRSAGPVTLAVLDARGRTVRRLISGVLEIGAHAATWDGEDDRGRRASAGLYFVELTFEGRRSSRKLVRF